MDKLQLSCDASPDDFVDIEPTHGECLCLTACDLDGATSIVLTRDRVDELCDYLNAWLEETR